jgi:hypothetical protein
MEAFLAATAEVHHLTLVTRDGADFRVQAVSILALSSVVSFKNPERNNNDRRQDRRSSLAAHRHGDRLRNGRTKEHPPTRSIAGIGSRQ